MRRFATIFFCLSIVCTVLLSLVSSVAAHGDVAAVDEISAETPWRGEYYNNYWFSGDPVALRDDQAIDFVWSAEPIAGVAADNFSVKWRKEIVVAHPMTVRFAVETDDDDQLLLIVNNVSRLNFGRDGLATADVDLQAGTNWLYVEYREKVGTARAKLTFAPVSDQSSPTAPAPAQPEGDECVIPVSGPWPACATGGSGAPSPTPPQTDGNACIIPPTGPWPACATSGSGAPSPTPPQTGGSDCVIPSSGPWPACATDGSGAPAPTPPQAGDDSTPTPTPSQQTAFDCAAIGGDMPQSECEVLNAIYRVNPDGRFGGTWVEDNDPCNLYWVTCDDVSGAVIKLSLAQRNLKVIPAEIGQLSALSTLAVSGNKLTTLPTEIGQLSALQTLSLEKNQLTALPAEISQLSALQHLYLQRNQLTVLPSEIGQLSALTILKVSGNDLTTLPPEIAQLSSLTLLYLASNEVTIFPAEILQLSNLKALRFQTNPMRGALPRELMAMSLNTLYFDFTQLCEPSDEVFQAWLNGISSTKRTHVLCEDG